MLEITILHNGMILSNLSGSFHGFALDFLKDLKEASNKWR